MTEEHNHIVSVKTYLVVFGALMVLLVLTVAASFFNFGPFSAFIAVGIAVAKASLIMAYFMHLRYSSKLVWVFAGLGFFGLIIMILLAMGDYVARGGIVVS